MIVKTQKDIVNMIKGGLALHGYNLSKIADKIGVTRPSLSRTVNRSNITLLQLIRIADAAGLCVNIDIVKTPIMRENTCPADVK